MTEFKAANSEFQQNVNKEKHEQQESKNDTTHIFCICKQIKFYKKNMRAKFGR